MPVQYVSQFSDIWKLFRVVDIRASNIATHLVPSFSLPSEKLSSLTSQQSPQQAYQYSMPVEKSAIVIFRDSDARVVLVITGIEFNGHPRGFGLRVAETLRRAESENYACLVAHAATLLTEDNLDACELEFNEDRDTCIVRHRMVGCFTEQRLQEEVDGIDYQYCVREQDGAVSIAILESGTLEPTHTLTPAEFCDLFVADDEPGWRRLNLTTFPTQEHPVPLPPSSPAASAMALRLEYGNFEARDIHNHELLICLLLDNAHWGDFLADQLPFGHHRGERLGHGLGDFGPQLMSYVKRGSGRVFARSAADFPFGCSTSVTLRQQVLEQQNNDYDRWNVREACQMEIYAERGASSFSARVDGMFTDNASDYFLGNPDASLAALQTALDQLATFTRARWSPASHHLCHPALRERAVELLLAGYAISSSQANLGQGFVQAWLEIIMPHALLGYHVTRPVP